MPRLLVAVLLASVVTSATTPAAAIEATAFNAVISDKLRKPEGACPDGAFRCGQAEIDGFGAAEWKFYVTSFVPSSASCGDYTAMATFTLADDSALVVQESGTVCAPGKSFFATPGFSWGNPDQAIGSWEVQSGSGQFAGVTGGGGTDHIRSAGADVRGIYTGSLVE